MNRAVKLLKSDQIFGTLFLGFLVFSSALAVVYTHYLHRHLHIELQRLQQSRDKLYVEWTQLLLEQGTLGSDIRAAEIANKRLRMQPPTDKQILVIKP